MVGLVGMKEFLWLTMEETRNLQDDITAPSHTFGSESIISSSSSSSSFLPTLTRELQEKKSSSNHAKFIDDSQSAGSATSHETSENFVDPMSFRPVSMKESTNAYEKLVYPTPRLSLTFHSRLK